MSKVTFCDAWGYPNWRRFLSQEGHANLTSKCSLCTCVQIAACKVDGPSVQPSTWHLYTLLMPPNCRQRGVIWVGIATSRAPGATGEGTSGANSNFFTTGVEASGAASWCSCGGGMEIVAVWDCGIFWVGVGWRTWRNVTWLPTKAHTNPPPPILPEPIESFLAPLSLTAVPPPSAHLPFLANPNPERRKRIVIWHVRLNHRIGRA